MEKKEVNLFQICKQLLNCDENLTEIILEDKIKTKDDINSLCSALIKYCEICQSKKQIPKITNIDISDNNIGTPLSASAASKLIIC